MVKLSNLSEGVVSSDIGEIVRIKNGLADKCVNSAIKMGFDRPRVEYSDTTDEDAIVYIEIGGNRYGVQSVPQSQIAMIQIMSDDDIKVQLPKDSAQRIGVRDYYKYTSWKDAMSLLNRFLVHEFSNQRGRGRR